MLETAQDEYAQLAQEGQKRGLEDGEERGAKRPKTEVEDEDDMEIEMEDDDDGELLLFQHPFLFPGRLPPSPRSSTLHSPLFLSTPVGLCLVLTAVAGDSVAVICTNLPAECNEDIMGALFTQYPGFTRAVAFNGPVPSSHPPPNENAKSFRALFASREQAEAAVKPLDGFVMQPGWNMAVSIEA